MRLHLLGVRGSTSAPGPLHVRYGGHTSCVAVQGAGEAVPSLLLDAGTGLRTLTSLLEGDAFHGTILLSHLHWDHVQGLPFFSAGDRDDAHVRVVLPAQLGRSGRDLVAQTLSPPAFPIAPEGLLGHWTFDVVEPGPVAVEGCSVAATEVAHKGGRTYGYRVERDGGSVGYLPDHLPRAGVSQHTLATLRGVDVLVHDAQFLSPEREVADAYGHATADDAVALAAEMGAQTLVLFHHAPQRTDDQLDALATEAARAAADTGTGLTAVVAREGQHLDVPS